MMTTAWIRQNTVTLPTTCDAFSGAFCPRNIDEIVAPPTATSTQNATTRFISGKVMARPVIAIAPTPRPIKTLSMMLYRDVARLAIMAGNEYCTSSRPIGRLPSSLGDDVCVGAVIVTTAPIYFITARPPRAVSLYNDGMSCPVCFITSTMRSKSTE